MGKEMPNYKIKFRPEKGQPPKTKMVIAPSLPDAEKDFKEADPKAVLISIDRSDDD